MYFSFSLFAQEHDGLCSVWRRTWIRWRGRAAQVPPGSKWHSKKKYSRQNSDLNKLPEITWRCSRSQWWNDAPFSDASRQDGKREEEEKEEQEEQEAPLWQQWFGERREEEGETKEGTVAFQVWPRVSRGWSPQTLIQLWSFLRLSGAGRGRQAYKADGGDNAGGWEEEAVQQPAGSQGTDWGGDGGLPHEALPSWWPHGLLPGPVRSLVFIFAHRPPVSLQGLDQRPCSVN